MAPRDIGLFIRSARTDAALARARGTGTARAAFEAAYAAGADPWASDDRRYSYQRWKYEGLMALLPEGRRFRHTLDLGSGVGVLSRKLSMVSDRVLGLDIAQAAVDRASSHAVRHGNLRFEQGDVTNLAPSLDGRFDLIVIADTLYYLDDTGGPNLTAIAGRIAQLLAPDGLCLLANHYFFKADPDSRRSRRIHQSFAASPGLSVRSEHWRPFYLASILEKVPDNPARSEATRPA